MMATLYNVRLAAVQAVVPESAIDDITVTSALRSVERVTVVFENAFEVYYPAMKVRHTQQNAATPTSPTRKRGTRASLACASGLCVPLPCRRNIILFR
jgi:hypothetical protein